MPILNTLNVLFSNEDFKRQYIKYNRYEKHKCEKYVYQDFCCGSACRSKEIFNDILTLHLQLGIDDLEVCRPIKTKATKYEVNATYFQIKNMPPEYCSKLDNIFLVALCSTINFKSHEYNYDHIAEVIVDEVLSLENDGLDIGDENIKGTVINIAGDNLGIHGVIGFSVSFTANYYCRHCQCSKAECQTMVKENQRKRRSKAKYAKMLERAEDQEANPSLTESKDRASSTI